MEMLIASQVDKVYFRLVALQMTCNLARAISRHAQTYSNALLHCLHMHRVNALGWKRGKSFGWGGGAGTGLGSLEAENGCNSRATSADILGPREIDAQLESTRAVLNLIESHSVLGGNRRIIEP